MRWIKKVVVVCGAQLFELRLLVVRCLPTCSTTTADAKSSRLPSLHPAIVREFREFINVTTSCDVGLFPVNLDMKQVEVLRTLFVDNKRTKIITHDTPEVIPVMSATDPESEILIDKISHSHKFLILLDLHDTGNDFIALTDRMWLVIARRRTQVIYVKLQVHDKVFYKKANKLPNQVHILSCPMLLGGSRFHITLHVDMEGDALFRKVFRSNPNPDYQFDWSWIGANTGKERASVLKLLSSLSTSGRYKAVCIISQPGHSDANIATVPYREYIEICRRSKICISLNGNGPWCLKDGELFANHCFVLRQYHPALEINPLTPKDGIHWKVFKTPKDLLEAIDYFLINEEERERIRNAGHELFRQVLFNNLWSRQYVDHLFSFLESPTKSAWGRLVIA